MQKVTAEPHARQKHRADGLQLFYLRFFLISNRRASPAKELGFTDEEQSSQNGILYIKQEHEAFDMIDNKEAQASFITAFPSISQIYEIAGAGERLPQKSTYFYPKLLSGIAINPQDK